MAKSSTFFTAAMLLSVSLVAASPASAAVTVSLSFPASTVPLGETINITAHASDSSNPNATFLYQFSVSLNGGATFNIQRDFYGFNYFNWTPSYQEGTRQVRVAVQEIGSPTSTASAVEPITVTSRVTGSSPVVNTTNNSLVALYSAPPCPSGNQVSVRFQAPGDTTWQMAPFEPYCDGVHSVNLYVGGMRANTTYTVQQIVLNGASQTLGPQLHFTTGSVPSSLNTSNPTTITPAPSSDTTYPFELRLGFGNGSYATDLQERVVWYFPPSQQSSYLVRAVPGGTFIGIQDENQAGDAKMLKEYDMAGNPIKETNWVILNQEINAYRAAHHLTPANVQLDFISHEGHRLSDGTTLMMVSEERVANQGNGPVDVLGDIILALDPNFQVKWAWDSFDWLNINRKALMNNTCTPGQGGCPAILFNKQPNGQTYTIANDWTHANSIAQDPSDGNVIISLRHQAWVIKVNYANATGDGHIIWTLGNQGSFTLANGLPSSEWFNFQHDAEFWPNGVLALFDNNNLQTGGTTSRGQVWSLDQTHLVATLVGNFDLGVQSFALGSAQWLPDGSYWFGAGFVNASAGESTEFTPSGTTVFKDQQGAIFYRTFRIPTMYDQ